MSGFHPGRFERAAAPPVLPAPVSPAPVETASEPAPAPTPTPAPASPVKRERSRSRGPQLERDNDIALPPPVVRRARPRLGSLLGTTATVVTVVAALVTSILIATGVVVVDSTGVYRPGPLPAAVNALDPGTRVWVKHWPSLTPGVGERFTGLFAPISELTIASTDKGVITGTTGDGRTIAVPVTHVVGTPGQAWRLP